MNSTKTPLTNVDIAYFLGVNPWNVFQYFARKNIKRRGKQIKQFGHPKKGERLDPLSYRLASQVYEAQDAGYFTEFSTEEIAGLLNISSRAVNYAIKNRGTIEPVLTQALQTIYPERAITTPYIQQVARTARISA